MSSILTMRYLCANVLCIQLLNSFTHAVQQLWSHPTFFRYLRVGRSSTMCAKGGGSCVLLKIKLWKVGFVFFPDIQWHINAGQISTLHRVQPWQVLRRDKAERRHISPNKTTDAAQTPPLDIADIPKCYFAHTADTWSVGCFGLLVFLVFNSASAASVGFLKKRVHVWNAQRWRGQFDSNQKYWCL